MYKQAILIRSDLEMGRGKIAAQAAHASLEAYKRSGKAGEAWEREGCKKIVLRVSGEAELLSLYEQAKRLKLPASLIHDAGHTQVEPGTATAAGIGPAKEEELNKVTGKLKLL